MPNQLNSMYYVTLSSICSIKLNKNNNLGSPIDSAIV